MDYNRSSSSGKKIGSIASVGIPETAAAERLRYRKKSSILHAKQRDDLARLLKQQATIREEEEDEESDTDSIDSSDDEDNGVDASVATAALARLALQNGPQQRQQPEQQTKFSSPSTEVMDNINSNNTTGRRNSFLTKVDFMKRSAAKKG